MASQTGHAYHRDFDFFAFYEKGRLVHRRAHKVKTHESQAIVHVFCCRTYSVCPLPLCGKKKAVEESEKKKRTCRQTDTGTF